MMHNKSIRKLAKLSRAAATALCGVALLLASAVGAHIILAREDSRAVDATGHVTAAGALQARSIACIGYVDVDSGVLPLQLGIAGRVAEAPVHVNESVKRGDVLLRLEDEPARAEVQQAEAGVQAAEAQLADAQKAPQQHRYLLQQQQASVAAAQHELEAARQAHARRRELIKEGSIPPAEVTAAEENIKRLDSALDAEQAKLGALKLRDPSQDIKKAEADLRAKQALLDKAKYNLQQHSLLAPANGKVLRIMTQRGDLVGPQSPQAAILFLPDEPRIIRAEVEQEFAGYVTLGQRAEISDDAFAGGPVWHGRVTRLSDWFAPRRAHLPELTQPVNVRTLECIVELDSTDPEPRIGQRMRVKLYR